MSVTQASLGNPARLQQWMQQQNISGSPAQLSSTQMQQASRELKLPLVDVLNARDALINQAATQNEQAGASSQQLRQSSTGAAASFGGKSLASSPAMTRFQAQTSGATMTPAMEAYRGARYTMDDVRAAQQAFNLPSLAAAKEFIGNAVLKGNEAVLREKGITPGNFDGHECMAAFRKSGYSESDVRTAMKKFDFLRDGTVQEAREYIGLKVLNNYESMLSEVGITRSNYDRHEMMDAFRSSGYSLEDARKAQQAFDFLKGSPLDEVKEYIGLKVLNNYESMLADVGITRGQWDAHECMAAFKRSGYSDADAKEAMKKFDFLKGGTLDEAKEYIGLKIVNNYESMLSEVGITRDNYDRHEMLEAFSKSGYSTADALAAKEKFDFLKNSSLGEVKEYIGLKVLNNYESMLSEVGITRNQWDSHELEAAFKNAGYSDAHARKAIAKFDFLKDASLQEAREYIGLKVVNNYEQMLRDVSITRN
ncbi:MAG: hypothetical protein AB2A00_12375 [Myxococcota bacterium]